MRKYIKYGAYAVLGLGLVASGAIAQQVMHNNQSNTRSPFASSVMVPAGYDTYYVSGKSGKGADTATQTADCLENLKAELASQGLTFGDVVQAHVFLVGANGGKMDFAGMNSSWFKVFGTADQPNKPARAAFQVAALAGADNLVEIEFIAVKKAR